MNKKFRDATIFYRFFDRKSEVVNIFMHGWGCDHNSLMFCNRVLNDSCLFVDFPPFGRSSKDIADWTIFTYANMVISLCQHLGIKKFNLIGHSFGGRVAIIIAAVCKSQTNKVVLVDSAGLKPKRKPNYYIKVWTYKIKKKMGLDTSKYGSRDYLALSPNMRKIFTNVVNTHLDDFLPNISAQTLIIFGEEDEVTPIYMAKRLNKKIKNSTLLLLPNCGHFCFLDRKLEFLEAVKNFLN